MRDQFGSKVSVNGLWVWFSLSLVMFGFQLSYGPRTLNLFQLHFSDILLPFAIRIDPLSCIMFSMVSLLSAVVGQYALRYLDGDPRQGYFYKHLLVTVLCVSMLVLSSNLVMFFLAWLGISWGIHNLLLYNQDRRGAIYAARKKFLVSRIGDLAIIIAIGLIYRIFGTFAFDELFAKMEAGSIASDHQTTLSLAAVLLATGAMTKSAQVPFHFWLPETMETPTPVSALMHAGVINAGGFLVLRLSPLVTHSQAASTLLTIGGALTAVYGALVMCTQNNIKTKLAYSTISQMGMMIFACGIHAMSFALFHILAHSFYKAYAFLTTGTLVEESKHDVISFSPLSLGVVLAGVGSLFAGVVYSAHWQAGEYLPNVSYLAVIVMGLLQIGVPKRPPLGFYRICTGVMVLAVGFYLAVETWLTGFVSIEMRSEPNLVPHLMALGIFALGLFGSRILMNPKSKLSSSLYLFFWNGGYFGVRTTRILSRLWAA